MSAGGRESTNLGEIGRSRVAPPFHGGFRTYHRQGRDILEEVADLLGNGPGRVLEFDPITRPVAVP